MREGGGEDRDEKRSGRRMKGETREISRREGDPEAS